MPTGFKPVILDHIVGNAAANVDSPAVIEAADVCLQADSHALLPSSGFSNRPEVSLEKERAGARPGKCGRHPGVRLWIDGIPFDDFRFVSVF